RVDVAIVYAHAMNKQRRSLEHSDRFKVADCRITDRANLDPSSSKAFRKLSFAAAKKLLFGLRLGGVDAYVETSVRGVVRCELKTLSRHGLGRVRRHSDGPQIGRTFFHREDLCLKPAKALARDRRLGAKHPAIGDPAQAALKQRLKRRAAVACVGSGG